MTLPMTTYHRYVIFDRGSATIADLEQCLRDVDPKYRIEGQSIMLADNDCGISVDVTHRGSPIFDNDLDLICRHARQKRSRDELVRRLATSTCMVTMQTVSGADERALECLWSWLRTHKLGVSVFEGGYFE